jgi:hypothetical protein
MNVYKHLLNDFDLRPLQIKKHLIDVHRITPRRPRKGYEREVWHSQHEQEHTTGISGSIRYKQ